MHRGALGLIAFSLGCAAPAPPREVPHPDVLIGQLDDPQVRVAAANALVAQGEAAVPALLAELERAITAPRPSRQREALRLLRALGPPGGIALPSLIPLSPRLDHGAGRELVRTVADLAPYRPPTLALDEADVGLLQHRGDRETALDLRRLRVRVWSDRHADLAALIAMASEPDAHRIELAVELLARSGSGARAALPALAAVLDRPDPRVTESTLRVPLRARAADAILQIDPAGTHATRARAVLAGTDPDPGDAPVPEQTQRQLDALVAAFATVEQRSVAAQHLIALGTEGVRAMLREVTAHPFDPTVYAQALLVADQPGPALAGCVPELAAGIRSLRPPDRSRLIDALAAAAPHTRDVLVVERGLIVRDRGVQADIDAAYQRLQAVLEVPTWLSNEALVERLNGWPPRVDRALYLLEERRAAARPILPALAAALRRDPQSQAPAFQHLTGFIRVRAASAILAIADASDPLVAEARKILDSDPDR